jgi:hypothetical protein
MISAGSISVKLGLRPKDTDHQWSAVVGKVTVTPLLSYVPKVTSYLLLVVTSNVFVKFWKAVTSNSSGTVTVETLIQFTFLKGSLISAHGPLKYHIWKRPHWRYSWRPVILRCLMRRLTSPPPLWKSQFPLANCEDSANFLREGGGAESVWKKKVGRVVSLCPASAKSEGRPLANLINYGIGPMAARRPCQGPQAMKRETNDKERHATKEISLSKGGNFRYFGPLFTI